MTLSEALLPEFDVEMANTRKSLERIPRDKLGWKPHERSMSMIDLATHLANLPSWVVQTIELESLDFAPPGEEPVRIDPAPSVGAAVEMLDENVAKARAALAGASDECLLAPWTLSAGGKPLFTMPRIAVVRGMIMSHMVHHRGQLTVYLRMNDVPLPALYGPSADEEG